MKLIRCKNCNRFMEVEEDAEEGICWVCIAKSVDFPEYKSRKKKVKRPLGWQRKKLFVDQEGNIYHRGKIQPKLKGTLQPTKVKKRKRLRKKDKEKITRRAGAIIYDLKKELKQLKKQKNTKTKQKKIERKIKNISKILNGNFKNYEKKLEM